MCAALHTHTLHYPIIVIESVFTMAMCGSLLFQFFAIYSMIFERKIGVHSSGVMTVLWLVLTLYGGIKLRTLILKMQDSVSFLTIMNSVFFLNSAFHYRKTELKMCLGSPLSVRSCSSLLCSFCLCLYQNQSYQLKTIQKFDNSL